MNIYEYDGKLHKARNKEELYRRLFKKNKSSTNEAYRTMAQFRKYK